MMKIWTKKNYINDKDLEEKYKPISDQLDQLFWKYDDDGKFGDDVKLLNGI